MVLERRRVAIDASLAINFVIHARTSPLLASPNNGRDDHAQTVAVLRSWAGEQAALVAPLLFESEADSVIRRYVYQGLLDRDAGKAAQELLDALPVSIVQDARVRKRARQIAETFNQDRVYDATYSALAELMGCEFWTADRGFYRAVRDSLEYVRFVGEFAALPS